MDLHVVYLKLIVQAIAPYDGNSMQLVSNELALCLQPTLSMMQVIRNLGKSIDIQLQISKKEEGLYTCGYKPVFHQRLQFRHHRMVALQKHLWSKRAMKPIGNVVLELDPC